MTAVATEQKLKPVLAYSVTTDDPEEAVICFAKTNVAARREGANEIGTDFGSVSCTRAHWADAYVGKDIPAKAYLDNGWCVSCDYCGNYVSHNTFGEDGEPHTPIFEGASLYCSKTCEDLEIWDTANRKGLVIEHTKAALAKFPGADVIRASDSSDRWVIFTFPGGHDQVTWIVGEAEVSVSVRDTEAFKAWNASIKHKSSN